jgi:hypothetical protein
LRVDRQELPQVGDEAPVEAGFGLASFPARCKLDRLQARQQRAIKVIYSYTTAALHHLTDVRYGSFIHVGFSTSN